MNEDEIYDRMWKFSKENFKLIKELTGKVTELEGVIKRLLERESRALDREHNSSLKELEQLGKILGDND